MNLPPTEDVPAGGSETAAIAYVAQYFPFLTETFVYREVEALRAGGFDVVTLSNRRPSLEQVSPEARHHLGTTTYVFPMAWFLFLTAHIFFAFGRPARYWGMLWAVLSQPGESVRNRWRTWGHFCGGVVLAYRLRDRGIGHVHAHFAVNAATLALVMAALLDISFSFTVHNNIFTDKLILRLKLQRARFIVSISAYSRDYLLRWASDVAGLAAKMHIVRCGLDPEAFVPSDGRLAADGVPHIFSLARFDEKKGMPVLVEALRQLRDGGRPFCARIGGDGPEFDRVGQLIETYELGEQVVLLGRLYQEEVQRHYRAADVFVLACVTAADGDVDGIPVVLMEAMALGRPVISTRVSGIPELIEDGISGLLVEEKSPAQLAAAIGRLLDGPEEARRMGANGRAVIEGEFNIHHSAQALTTLFRRYVTAGEEVA